MGFWRCSYAKVQVLFFLLCWVQLGILKSNENIPNANDFLRLYEQDLKEAYRLVLYGSQTRNYVLFHGYHLIDYEIYKMLSQKELQKIKKPLIFFYGILKGKPFYSELGGVSIMVVLASNVGDKKAPVIALNFQGRYFSDLLTIGEDGEFYALCAPPSVHRCLLLGIGEKWW